MDAVGDMARALVLRTNQVRLRDEMDKLAVEIATGYVRDKAQHLGGDTTGLLSIDRTLDKLDTYRVNTTEATFISASMQNALDEIQNRTENLSQTLIAADLTPNSSLLNTMADDAQNALAQVLNGMNRSVAGRALFAGVATDGQAVQGLEDVLSQARTALAGTTTLADVQTALDSFFAPGGTFDTVSYTGSDTGLAEFQLSETEEADLDIRANDPQLKAALKPMIMAALATDGTLGYSTEVQVELLGQAGRDLLGAQQNIVELRAGLGAMEARIENASAQNSSEITATKMARLELVGAEQYESAARYENIRVQLESLYTITARSQRLSLAEYL